MKKYSLAYLSILAIVVSACSNGSKSSNGGSDFGVIKFSNDNVQLGVDGKYNDILALTGSSNVSGMSVTLSVADNSIISLDRTSCVLSSESDDCIVNIKAGATGQTVINATASYNGHIYSVTPVEVTVSENINPVNPTVKASLEMTESGITQTIYAGTTYNATFTFTNNTGSAIAIESATVSGINAFGSAATKTDLCTGSTIAANGGSCAININNINIATVNTLAALDFILSSTSNQQYISNMNIVAVKNYSAPNSDANCPSGCAAFRIANTNNPGHTLYVATVGKNSQGNQQLVQFTKNANGDYIGTLAPEATTYPEATITVPDTAKGITLYQPNYSGLAGGVGGLMYVSLDKVLPIVATSSQPNPGAVGPAPWSGNVGEGYGVTYSAYEPNVWRSVADSSQLHALLDVTDINVAGVTQGFDGVDITTNVNKNAGFLAYQYQNMTTSQIYTQIQTTLSQGWSDSWGVAGLFQQEQNNWVAIFGAVNWLGQNPTDYSIFGSTFNPNLYTQYVNDLWTYYASGTSNYIYIDASEIMPGCVLQAQVSPTDANVMQVQPKTGNTSCTVTSTTGPNSWTWTKFTAADFVGGAASNPPSTLYGVNKTYRSMGKYVSAAQSVGFLPYCSNANIVYGPNVFNSQAETQYWANPTGQYGCLANATNGYGNSIMNQYDKVFHQYIPLNYAWAYDDVLVASSAVTSNANLYGFTLDIHKFQ